MSIRLLLVDDHFLVRAGLSSSLGLEKGMEVVAEAANAVEAIAAYRTLRPDVVLMDSRMPDLSGVEATEILRKETPPARVIMLTALEGEEDIFAAVKAGAAGYVSKSARFADVVDAINAVHRGGSYFPPEANAKLVARLQRPELSARELDVLRHIARGERNKRIAVELGICEDTVKQHVAALLAKLNADNRAHAASIAIQRGILHVD